ncbi:hypothetical protein BD410DRAFT_611712 [Rickenella mellea]|uniref:Uncharacterized protein n=1 Tax=Rickenella mellea TaxID=50990 RepID=A0A4Y7PQG7_9AGAM|nr:hypothetical protein BD410DRAFT_611712 [Rickenella mellea]
MTVTTVPKTPAGSETPGFCTIEDITIHFGLFDTSKKIPVSFRLYIDETEVGSSSILLHPPRIPIQDIDSWKFCIIQIISCEDRISG